MSWTENNNFNALTEFIQTAFYLLFSYSDAGRDFSIMSYFFVGD